MFLSVSCWSLTLSRIESNPDKRDLHGTSLQRVSDAVRNVESRVLGPHPTALASCECQQLCWAVASLATWGSDRCLAQLQGEASFRHQLQLSCVAATRHFRAPHTERALTGQQEACAPHLFRLSAKSPVQGREPIHLETGRQRVSPDAAVGQRCRRKLGGAPLPFGFRPHQQSEVPWVRWVRCAT